MPGTKRVLETVSFFIYGKMLGWAYGLNEITEVSDKHKRFLNHASDKDLLNAFIKDKG